MSTEKALGELISVRYGKALREEDRDRDGDYPVFGSAGEIGRHSQRLIDEATIVIGRKGSVGEITHAPHGGWPIDTTFYVERIDPDSLDLRFLFHLLKNLNLQQHRITTSIPGLNRDDIYRKRVRIPGLAAQKRIAAILDKADAIRRKREQTIKLADEFLRSLFLDMFGDPVRNPKRWPIRRLGELAEDLRYGTSAKCAANRAPGAVPVLRIPNVTSGSISYSELKFATLSEHETSVLALKPGDILFVRTNGNPEFIGRCAVFNDKEPMLFASYLIRARLSKPDAVPMFLAAMFATQSYRALLLSHAKTTAGNYNVSASALSNLPIILPPKSLQQIYANSTERLGVTTGKLQQSLILATELQASLTARAFRNQL